MHEREVGSTLMGLAEIEQLCIQQEADGSIRDVGAALESHTASWSTRFDPSKRAARGDGAGGGGGGGGGGTRLGASAGARQRLASPHRSSTSLPAWRRPASPARPSRA